jgi:hypothetical protein
MRKIPDTLTTGTTHAERIEMLRFDFQERVGQYSVEPWSLSPQETSDLLTAYSVVEILPALTKVGRAVQKLRNWDLIFLTQEEILILLEKHLRRAHLKTEGEKEARRLAREQKEAAWLERRALVEQ